MPPVDGAHDGAVVPLEDAHLGDAVPVDDGRHCALYRERRSWPSVVPTRRVRTFVTLSGIFVLFSANMAPGALPRLRAYNWHGRCYIDFFRSQNESITRIKEDNV